MAEQKYALILDASNPKTNWQGIGQYLRDSIWIKGWANHLPYVFFLKSELDTHDLTPKIQAIVNPTRFVLIKMNPRDVNGWMPQPTWDWINEVPPPAYLTSGLFGGLLPSPGQTGNLTPLDHQTLIDSLLQEYNPKPATFGELFDPGTKRIRSIHDIGSSATKKK